MTKIELAREIAKRTTARFIEIAPRRRPRVGDAMRNLREKVHAAYGVDGCRL